MKKNILSVPSKECCGCGLCELICNTGAIAMKSDDEGFLHPFINDASKCVNCGKCLDFCTIRTSNLPRKITNRIGYKYFYMKDNEILVRSSSGALAHYISEKCIKDGYYVSGVRYAKDFCSAFYELTNDERKLELFRGSKYIQAEKRGIFFDVGKKLIEEEDVLFIGLPCDVAALKSYLKYRNIDDSNLIVCDIVCHGPTSAMIQKLFICDLEREYNAQITDFSCRFKNPNWKPYYIYAEFENGFDYKTPFSKSDLGIAFQFLKRPSCNVCKFKGGITAADFTIGDFHGASKETGEFNDKGVSICLINTKKGLGFLSEKIGDDCIFKETEPCRALNNIAIIEPIKKLMFREKFARDIRSCGLKKTCRKSYVQVVMKARVLNKKLSSLKKRLSICK